MGAKKFCYSCVDYIHKVPIRHSIDCCRNGSTASKFDKLLCKSWDDARESGCFRYVLEDPLPTKVLSGSHGFVVQLNEKRAVERRKPQDIVSVSQPFDERLFNFTKVAEREVMFELEKMSSSNLNQQLRAYNYSMTHGHREHLLVINVSPLEYGNSLFVPFADSRLPQVLTREGIEMAIELVLLSSTPAFRVGFNSLCANASVNHFHFHVFYLGHKLALETVAVRTVVGDCYEISGDYPAVGFAFQSTAESSDVGRLSKSISILSLCYSIVAPMLIFRVSEYFQANGIPHNLFVTRGASFDVDDGRAATENVDGVYDAVRVFLWARKPVYGIKDDLAFNVACCELSGHLPVKQRHSYDAITEDEVSNELSDACLETFNQVRPAIVELLRKRR